MKTLQELTTLQYSKKLIGLKTKQLGRNYVVYEEIDSTQKEIWRKIQKNSIVDGTLIRANKQTSGIGTHGRVWYSTQNNITFSFFMKLNCMPNELEGLTLEIANIIVKILKDEYKIDLEIKIPNDIYKNGKKLGGILTETKVSGSTIKYLVVGIGINNSQMEFCSELKDIATSIKKEFGIEIDVEQFIASFCNQFEKTIEARINKGD